MITDIYDALKSYIVNKLKFKKIFSNLYLFQIFLTYAVQRILSRILHTINKHIASRHTVNTNISMILNISNANIYNIYIYFS